MTVAIALLSLIITPMATDRPNVLIVLCDDLRWDCLGCTGHPHLKTPHIDRIAREGVLFKNAFCTTSLCSPSRASLLSGRYAHKHGVRDNFTELPADLPTFPKSLQAAGYSTAYFGKWHMGENNDSKRPGFNAFATHKGQGKYFDTEWNINGERKVVPGYYTSVVTDLAIDWLKNKKADQPWMLMVGHKAPHSFYVPEPKYAHAFDSVKVDYPESAFHLDDKPTWIRQRLDTWHGIYGPLFDFRKKFPDRSPEAVRDFQAMTRSYWGTILSVDDSVGRLLAQLESRGELDHTLVVFLGDNGLLNGEHGMVDKRTMHEPSIRIPLLARYKGFKPGTIEDRMVLTTDLAPSILDVCGATSLPGTQGRSWATLARGDATRWRDAWVYAYDYEKQFPYTPNVRGVRTDHYKYVRYPHGDGSPDRHQPELYDLVKDPYERVNRAADPAMARVRSQLEKRLAELKAEIGLIPDPMPIDMGIGQALPDLKIR